MIEINQSRCNTSSVTTGSPLDLASELEVRLAEARGQLSANDERIAAFLREHLGGLAFHTADSLAQGAGVSAAAVVRFARRLGYANFRELRDRARDDLRSEPAPDAAPADGPASTLACKAQRDIASLQLLSHMLDETLTAATRAIARASTCWVLANRETHGLAVYTHRLLHHARSTIALVDPSFPDPLRDADERTVLLAITFRPYARQTLELVAHARSAGAQIVLVTDGLAHDFIEPADIVLAVPVDSPTLFLSFTPALCVLESLAAMVAGVDADETYETLEATSRFVERQALMLERGPLRGPPER